MTSVDWEAARRERQERARQERSSSEAPPPPEIATIDFPSIPDEQPPPRRFVWSEWLPTGCLSSLYGAGGIGKTLLVQQLATHVVCGASFLGARTQGAPVFGLFAEDDDDELIRRQWRINRSFGIKNSSLRDLHIQGRAGLDNVLANYPANGEPEPWPLFEATLAKARELQPGLVILDNRAQMLLGNENDRATATWSANLLAGLAREIGAAVLLLGHVAKADGSSYSGSTGWDAVVRSRWWLRRPEEDGSDDQPELILERVKSNYARPDEVRLLWTSDGVLEPAEERHQSEQSRLARKLREREVVQAFLDLLDQLTAQRRPVSHSSQAQNYAPKVMRKANPSFSLREYANAMEILFAEGRIRASEQIFQGADRHWRTGIARTSEGADQEDGGSQEDDDAAG